MPTSQPTVITSISGTGPLMALDLTTAPLPVILPIVQAAMRVAAEWESANIPTPECEGAEEALTELSKTVTALDDLLEPIIPGAPHTTRDDLVEQDAYAVIRNGRVEHLGLADLTRLELTAVHSWLEFHKHVAGNHADAIKQRMDELASEAA
ncbi:MULTISPECIES: hypothetical protein [unclassified Acidovorax]|uniref:hypothetical protein n=1 Tax=unclassified Acidovorax TaxID=2684926 RepID=UPI0028835001|nr:MULTISPECIES: hypothetical protein [unclassified Acidovorax]